MIAGYIDIILKRQKAKDHIGIEGDEGSTMVEDSVSPAKASTIQLTPALQPVQYETQNIALPSVVRPSPESEKIALPGHAPITKHKTETGGIAQGQRVQIVSVWGDLSPGKTSYTVLANNIDTIYNTMGGRTALG